jgi:hypothetical protein
MSAKRSELYIFSVKETWLEQELAEVLPVVHSVQKHLDLSMFFSVSFCM